MRWLDHRIPPPVVGAFVAGAMWTVAQAGPQFALEARARWVLVGIAAVVGIAFDLLGLVSFRRSRTTINPLRPERSTALVTSGVYRFTRNPMYLGMAFLLLSWAIYLSSLLPFAGPLVFVWYITRFQIEPEERALERIFGEEFSNYAARVGRWV